ncbi:MAG: hypothetical protein K8R46_09825, partial [Pirellulales bacterium]|nr:hypothetical protein [Pirellulales bacterium]
MSLSGARLFAHLQATGAQVFTSSQHSTTQQVFGRHVRALRQRRGLQVFGAHVTGSQVAGAHVAGSQVAGAQVFGRHVRALRQRRGLQ